MPDVSSIIQQTFREKNFGLVIADPNTKVKPTSRVPFVELRSLEAANKPLDLRDNDERKFIFQVELNYPIGSGDTDIKAKSNEILEGYSFNESFTGTGYSMCVVEKREKEGYTEKAWFRKTLQIYFRAFVTR